MKKIIVFDTETTGLNPTRDEILQFSAIDGDGRTLLNTYIKPVYHTSWNEAMAVHGITPAMVATASTMENLRDKINQIMSSADLLVAYNATFDLNFLRYHTGFSMSDQQELYDVMLKFAEVYGEWHAFFCSYKWQKLITAAHYYGYCFNAHDSLEDVRATLYVYNQITKKGDNL